jgi:hypothetical protein
LALGQVWVDYANGTARGENFSRLGFPPHVKNLPAPLNPPDNLHQNVLGVAQPQRSSRRAILHAT